MFYSFLYLGHIYFLLEFCWIYLHTIVRGIYFLTMLLVGWFLVQICLFILYVLILYTVSLLNSILNFLFGNVKNHVICNYSFISSFLFCKPLIYYSCYTALYRVSDTTPGKSENIILLNLGMNLLFPIQNNICCKILIVNLFIRLRNTLQFQFTEFFLS